MLEILNAASFDVLRHLSVMLERNVALWTMWREGNAWSINNAVLL